MTFFINQLMLIAFNIINVYVDAYLILNKKNVAHAVNFIAYSVFTAITIYLFNLDIFQAILFCFSAFFNRQISFDIPLNLRRHLSWDYVTKQNPPGSILDRIEIRLFGYNGRAPTIIYGLSWIITILLNYLIYG